MITPLIKHADNLLQCFYIIGLDKTSIFNPKIYKSEHVDLIPSLISKFPYYPLPYMQFPDKIILHVIYISLFNSTASQMAFILKTKPQIKPLKKTSSYSP